MCCVWEGTPVYTSTPAMDIVNAQRQFFKGYPPLHLYASALTPYQPSTRLTRKASILYLGYRRGCCFYKRFLLR